MMSAEQIITLALNPENRAPPLGITTDVTPLKIVGLNNYRWLQGVPTWDTFWRSAANRRSNKGNCAATRSE